MPHQFNQQLQNLGKQTGNESNRQNVIIKNSANVLHSLGLGRLWASVVD
jgi:hypothetical protein